jgi:dTDP-4-dehydrorhamnose 3,5-epimerase
MMHTNSPAPSLERTSILDILIDGVAIKELVRHRDERGYFQEIIRVSDDFFGEGFGQWSMSRMHPGVIKAWHYHKKQVDWWFVSRGNVKAVLHDLREGSPTRGVTQEFLMGEDYAPIVLRIPTGVLHGCKVIGAVTELSYITSLTYDPADEFRLAHDDPGVGYDWYKGHEIV